MALATQRREELDQKAWKQEMALSKKIEEVEQAVHQYNKLAEGVHIVPSTARFAEGREFRLTFKPNAAVPVDLDLRRETQPALIALREKLSQMVHATQAEALGAKEAVNKLTEAIAEKQDEVRVQESSLAALEQQYAQEKEVRS